MNERLTTYDSKMTKTINNLDGELATIRAGRANPHVLDKLTVDYYGSDTDPTGGKRICPGSKDDSDPAVGKEHAQRD
mgnify:CR=1 FL=1